MKLTVKDLFNISIFSQFKLIAGAGGLDKPCLLYTSSYLPQIQALILPKQREHAAAGESGYSVYFIYIYIFCLRF